MLPASVAHPSARSGSAHNCSVPALWSALLLANLWFDSSAVNLPASIIIGATLAGSMTVYSDSRLEVTVINFLIPRAAPALTAITVSFITMNSWQCSAINLTRLSAPCHYQPVVSISGSLSVAVRADRLSLHHLTRGALGVRSSAAVASSRH